MGQVIELETPRLRLRAWRAQDCEPFAALNADAEVMAHFTAPLTRAQSDAMAERIAAGMAARGWGLWALELKASGAFIGFTGLNPAPAALPFAPAIEIGWRLARPFWGRGLASEAAQCAADCAFEQIGLDEIVSFTALANQRSVAVMQRLGMVCAGQFDHVGMPEGHALRRHWLYRLDRVAASRILGA